MEKENNFADLIVWHNFHNILLKIDNFTLIVLTIIVPVFDLGMLLGKV